MQISPEVFWIIALLTVLIINHRIGLKLIKTVQERYPQTLNDISDVYDPTLRFRMNTHTKMINTIQRIRHTEYEDQDINFLKKKWLISSVLIFSVGILFIYYLL